MALTALIVAVAAAIVALLSFVWTVGWSLWQHRRLTRPRIKVRGRFGVIGGVVTPPSGRIFGFSATNVGQVPVTLIGVSATAKGAESSIALVVFKTQAPGPLPWPLGPGEKWDGFVDGETFRQGISELSAGPPPWRVRVAVTDAAGVSHESGWIDVNRGPALKRAA